MENTYFIYLAFHLVSNSQGTLYCSYMKYIASVNLNIRDGKFHFLRQKDKSNQLNSKKLKRK